MARRDRTAVGLEHDVGRHRAVAGADERGAVAVPARVGGALRAGPHERHARVAADLGRHARREDAAAVGARDGGVRVRVGRADRAQPGGDGVAAGADHRAAEAEVLDGRRLARPADRDDPPVGQHRAAGGVGVGRGGRHDHRAAGVEAEVGRAALGEAREREVVAPVGPGLPERNDAVARRPAGRRSRRSPRPRASARARRLRSRCRAARPAGSARARTSRDRPGPCSRRRRRRSCRPRARARRRPASARPPSGSSPSRPCRSRCRARRRRCSARPGTTSRPSARRSRCRTSSPRRRSARPAARRPPARRMCPGSSAWRRARRSRRTDRGPLVPRLRVPPPRRRPQAPLQARAF